MATKNYGTWNRMPTTKEWQDTVGEAERTKRLEREKKAAPGAKRFAGQGVSPGASKAEVKAAEDAYDHVQNLREVDAEVADRRLEDMKGAFKKYAKGGKVRGDGIAQRGRTKGRMI